MEKKIKRTRAVFAIIFIALLLIVIVDSVKSLGKLFDSSSNVDTATNTASVSLSTANSMALMTYDTEVIVDAETKVEYILFKNETGDIISITPRYNNKGEIMTCTDTATVSFYYQPIME